MDSTGKFARPSSATQGFFQEVPKLQNQFEEDFILRRTAQLFLPASLHSSLFSQLHSFGSEVLTPQIFAWITDAESNPPTFSSHDLLGRPRSILRTSEGWRSLQAFGIRHGIWTTAYDQDHAEHARLFQFLKYHLWSGSCATTTCPAAMADGAASLLGRHISDPATDALQRRVLQTARQRLLSRDPATAWTSGQWMTERSGGSDVRSTETLAAPAGSAEAGSDAAGDPLGPWSVSGFKWFSSATDAQMTILLARTARDEISAFYAPLHRAPEEPSGALPLNGIAISRLKPKVGTRALPTAELQLVGLRAHMLGQPGRGTRELATVLTVTRVHTALSALGFWGRGLAIARAYARVRRVAGGRLLTDVPAHVRGLADLTVRYAGNMSLGFFTVACLGISTSAPGSSKISGPLSPSPKQAGLLLRLLTPVSKAIISTAACHGLRDCMEALGGIGYLEDPAAPELNIARLLRDCLVLPIWEGTTDVLAEDVAKVLTSKREGEAVQETFYDWVEGALSLWTTTVWEEQTVPLVRRELKGWLEMAQTMGREELCFNGKEVMGKAAWIVSAVVLVEDARKDGNMAAKEVASRWIALKAGGNNKGWNNVARLDRMMVFPPLESDPAGVSKL